MRYCIGIDLGGTNIAGGIADLDGKLLLTDSIKTGLPCPASDIADRIAVGHRRPYRAALPPHGGCSGPGPE